MKWAQYAPAIRSVAADGDLREAFRLLWSESDVHVKRSMKLAFVIVVGSALLAAMTPVAYKLVIDAFAGGVRGDEYLAGILVIAAYVSGQYLLKVLGALRELVYAEGEQRLHRRLSRRLFAHLMTLPLRFHLDRKIGALSETLAQGLNGYKMILQHLIYTFLPVAIEFLTIGALLIFFGHATYLAIFGLSAVAYAVAFGRGAASITEPSRTISTSHINTHAALTDSLLNYETVKYFSAEPIVCKRYDGALAETESAWVRFFRRRTRNGLVVATIFGASLGTALTCAAREVLRGTMTIGDFVLINSYVLRLVQPLETVGYAVRDISQGLAFLQKLLELFREKPERENAVGHVQFSDVRGEVTFDQVSFSYGPDRLVLKNVSFSIPAGRTVAIVGASGSGKSSLVRLLFRLYEPDNGRLLLDGIPISNSRFSDLRQAIAVVPQDTILFNDTIAGNIAFGKQGSTQQQIERAAILAHLHQFVMSLPEGYDTIVGERGLKLSGGERQRVAIARAALKQPRIFVFDEATSSLDTTTEREILQNLIEVSKGSTTLVIAHRLSTVVYAHEIVVLNGGTIVERGTHSSLLQLNGSYAAMWRAQQHVTPMRDTQRVSVA